MVCITDHHFKLSRALGVLLYTILYGENPFHEKSDIFKCRYTLPSHIDPGNLYIALNIKT